MSVISDTPYPCQYEWSNLFLFTLYHHHHHQVMLSARISLTLSRHPSLSPIFFTAGLQGYIPYRHRASVCRFKLVKGSAMWRGPQKYITYEFVPTSPAMSCMSGSPAMSCMSGSWWMGSGCIATSLWGSASRTCSILLTAFFGSCHQAFSPSV